MAHLTNSEVRAAGFAFELMGDIRLTFQRYVALSEPFQGLPTSLGALPCGAVGRQFLLPLEAPEAVWIGCELPVDLFSTRIEVNAHWLEGGVARESAAIEVPARTAVAIISGFACVGGAYKSIAPPTSKSLDARLSISLTREAPDGQRRGVHFDVTLCRYDAFLRKTGRRVAPLDADGGYKGFRLP